MFARRLAQLFVGLALYGLGIALQVASRLGNDPWDTLHQGLARQTGLSIGPLAHVFLPLPTIERSTAAA